MAYVEIGDGIADDTVVLRQLKGSPVNIGEYDSGLQVIVDALNDLDGRIDAVVAGHFGLRETSETIASGVITASYRFSQYCIADTEGGAGTDSITRIVNATEGGLFALACTSADRVITVEHGTYMRMANGRNFTLNNVNDNILFRVHSGGVCRELTRSSNV